MKRISLFLIVLFFLFACEKPMPFDGVKYILNSNIIKTSIAFQFINSKTKEPIGLNNNKKVLVKVLGPDKGAVLSISGFSKNSFESSRGFLSLGLNTNFTPSKSRKLDVTLVFESSGYLSNSMRLNISSIGNHFQIVQLVEISNPPLGVAVAQSSSSSLQNGQTTADIFVQTPVVSYSNTKASIKIDQGTIIKDKKGTILSPPLKIILAYYNNMLEDPLSAHPGGLISRVDSGGKTSEGAFSTAGYVNCEISDKNGKKAYSFSKTITYKVEVNSASTNPLTGTNIQIGEKLGVWSYNNESVIWNFVKTAIFTGPLSNGNFELVSKVNKLLPYNWDWFEGNCNCKNGIDLTFNYPEAIGNFGIQIKAYGEASNQLISTYNFVVKNGDKVNIDGSPFCSGVFLFAYNDCGELLSFIHANDLCNGSYQFDLLSPMGDKTVSINLNGQCGPDPSNVLLRPNSPIWYQLPCGNTWQAAGSLDNGKITLNNLKANQNYTYGTYFDNKWVSFQFTTDANKTIENQMLLSSELCSILNK